MKPIGFYTKFTTSVNDRDSLIAILSQAATTTRNNTDCRLYIVNKDTEDDTITWVTEIWNEEAAHTDSLKTPEAQLLITQAIPLLTSRPEQITLQPIIGKGL